MFKKATTAIIAFTLLSTLVLGIVSASPRGQAETEPPFEFLINVLVDADEKGALPDGLSGVLAEWLIENLIAPHTGETPEQVRIRHAALGQSSLLFMSILFYDTSDEGVLPLAIALTDANDKGLLSDSLNNLLAELFIENLIAPHTGETPEQIRSRLSVLAARKTATAMAMNTPTETPTTMPTNTPTQIPTPTVPPLTEWDTYKNGVYGFSVGIPLGWVLDGDSETDEYASFWSPDRKGINEVWIEYPRATSTLESLGERRRDRLTSRAQANSWPVFDVISGGRRSGGWGEFYELVFRWQSAEEYCVSRVVERLRLVSLYPSDLYSSANPALWGGTRRVFARDRSADKRSYEVGVIARAGICERHLSAYSAVAEAFQDSFVVWNGYWDEDYGYGLNVPPGWSSQKEFGGATLRSPDRSALVEVTSYYYPSPHSTTDDLKAQRLQQYRQYANTWTLFESKGNIQSIGHRVIRSDGTYWLVPKPKKYLATFRAQVSSQYCVMDYSELMVMSTYHPDHPYGFLVTASVCENSPYLQDSREMLEGFRY